MKFTNVKFTNEQLDALRARALRCRCPSCGTDKGRACFPSGDVHFLRVIEAHAAAKENAS